MNKVILDKDLEDLLILTTKEYLSDYLNKTFKLFQILLAKLSELIYLFCREEKIRWFFLGILFSRFSSWKLTGNNVKYS